MSAGTWSVNCGGRFSRNDTHALAGVGGAAELGDGRGVDAVGGHRVVLAEHPPQHLAGHGHRDRRRVGRRSPGPARRRPAAGRRRACTDRTRPRSRASWASKTRPVIVHSSAVLMPDDPGQEPRRARLGHDAPPGEHEPEPGRVARPGGCPSAASSWRPTPTAGPLIAAITGLVHWKMRRVSRPPSSRWACGSAPPVAGLPGVDVEGVAAALEVGAGAEPPAPPGDHHHPDLGVLVDPVERRPQLALHRDGEGVEAVGPVEGDREDPVGEVGGDG